MSAFGQAGFGSRNRQNQLRAQGQMDPYGNQVRQAKQAPTFNIYSQQPQPAPSSRPATPRPQPASMPAYGGQPQTGGPFPTYDSVMGPQATGPTPTMGQAQPIQPASTGTPYQQAPADEGLQNVNGVTAQAPITDRKQADLAAKREQRWQAWNQMQPLQKRENRLPPPQNQMAANTPENPLYGADGTTLARIAAQFHNAGKNVPPELSQALSQVRHTSLKSQYDARYVSPDMWRNASQQEKDALLVHRDGKGDPIAGPSGSAMLNVWSQDQMQQFSDKLQAHTAFARGGNGATAQRTSV